MAAMVAALAAGSFVVGSGAPAGAAAPWAYTSRDFRVPVTIGANGFSRSDHTADVAVDFTSLLTAAGATGAFDPASLRVVQVDGAGNAVDTAVPFQFDRGAGYNASTNAVGTLVVGLTGSMTASASRTYHVYFDEAGGTWAPVTVTPRVTLTTGVQDEGHPALRVTNSVGSWWYHTAGGGFSSLNDVDGRDWLSWNSAAGAAGQYRGMPNAVNPEGHFHPGHTTSTTSVVNSGPLKVTFRSVTADGWASQWEIGPRTATMTMQQAPNPYWFLYEGTPGGEINATTDTVIRANGTTTSLSTRWTADLPAAEWVAFADPGDNRAIVVANHARDTKVDSHYLLQSNMTVFGFGRSGLNKYLTGVNRFTATLVDASTHAALAPIVPGLYEPLAISLGAPEPRNGGGGPTLPTLSIADNAKLEGNSGTVSRALKVTLSAPSATSVTVRFATANGTAVAPSDYGARTGTLTIAAGKTVGYIGVGIVGDTVVEPNEQFTVTLSSPVGAMIARATGTFTIQNDD